MGQALGEPGRHSTDTGRSLEGLSPLIPGGIQRRLDLMKAIGRFISH
jgi:hypothetical protein